MTPTTVSHTEGPHVEVPASSQRQKGCRPAAFIKDDHEAHNTLLAVNTGVISGKEGTGLEFGEDDFSLIDEKTAFKYFSDIKEAVANTKMVADLCEEYDLELGTAYFPDFPIPEGKTAEEYLEEICWNGIEGRYGKNSDPKVVERLKYELSVVEKTGFAGYFLIVWEFVKWAKDNRIIVGPGRRFWCYLKITVL